MVLYFIVDTIYLYFLVPLCRQDVDDFVSPFFVLCVFRTSLIPFGWSLPSFFLGFRLYTCGFMFLYVDRMLIIFISPFFVLCVSGLVLLHRAQVPHLSVHYHSPWSHSCLSCTRSSGKSAIFYRNFYRYSICVLDCCDLPSCQRNETAKLNVKIDK